MTLQIIPFASLLVLATLALVKRPPAFIIAVTANCVCCGFSAYWDSINQYDFCTMESMSFLSVCMCLILLPLLRLDLSAGRFVCPDDRRVRMLALIVIIATVPATGYFLQYVGHIFEHDISALRIENKMNNAVLSVSILHRLFISCSYLYVIALGLFVYGFIRQVFSRRVIILLFVGSLSYPLSGFYLYSRGIMLLYGVTLFAFAILGFRFCRPELRYRLVRGFVTMALILSVPFAFITVERFSDNKEQGLFEYVGGGPRYFSRIYHHSEYWMKDPSALFLRPFSMLWDKFVDRAPSHERMLDVYETNKVLTYSEESTDEPSAPFITMCGALLAEFSESSVLAIHVGLALIFAWIFGMFRRCMTLPGLMVCGCYLVTAIMYSIGYMYMGTPGNMAFILIALSACVLRGGRREEVEVAP